MSRDPARLPLGSEDACWINELSEQNYVLNLEEQTEANIYLPMIVA